MRHPLAEMLSLGVLLTAVFPAEVSRLESEGQKIGYSIGYQVGGDFKRQGLVINPEMVIRGVLDALAGSESLMTEDEMERTLARLQSKARAAQEQERQEIARRNLIEGSAFLAKNGEREGVTILPSGLQYRVVEEGTGRTPSATDTVTVHYRGALIDGSEFENTYERGEPATFGLEGAIPGWNEALQLMKEGARWHLFVPPGLGYGDRDSDHVGPNSTLIFELELISVDTVE